MKRGRYIGDDDNSYDDGNEYDEWYEQKCDETLNKRDAAIAKIKREYLALVTDFELYYSDESQLLCEILLHDTKLEIDMVIKIAKRELYKMEMVYGNENLFKKVCT